MKNPPTAHVNTGWKGWSEHQECFLMAMILFSFSRESLTVALVFIYIFTFLLTGKEIVWRMVLRDFQPQLEATIKHLPISEHRSHGYAARAESGCWDQQDRRWEQEYIEARCFYFDTTPSACSQKLLTTKQCHSQSCSSERTCKNVLCLSDQLATILFH